MLGLKIGGCSLRREPRSPLCPRGPRRPGQPHSLCRRSLAGLRGWWMPRPAPVPAPAASFRGPGHVCDGPRDGWVGSGHAAPTSLLEEMSPGEGGQNCFVCGNVFFFYASASGHLTLLPTHTELPLHPGPGLAVPVCVCVLSRARLWDPADCNLPASSVRGFPSTSAGAGCHFLSRGSS